MNFQSLTIPCRTAETDFVEVTTCHDVLEILIKDTYEDGDYRVDISYEDAKALRNFLDKVIQDRGTVVE